MPPLLAVTETPDWGALPWGWIVLGLVVLLAVYVLRCLLFPFGHCWWCKGRGRRSTKSGKHFGNCWFCKGSGRKLRRGRRVINKLIAVHRDGS